MSSCYCAGNSQPNNPYRYSSSEQPFGTAAGAAPFFPPDNAETYVNVQMLSDGGKVNIFDRPLTQAQMNSMPVVSEDPSNCRVNAPNECEMKRFNTWNIQSKDQPQFSDYPAVYHGMTDYKPSNGLRVAQKRTFLEPEYYNSGCVQPYCLNKNECPSGNITTTTRTENVLFNKMFRSIDVDTGNNGPSTCVGIKRDTQNSYSGWETTPLTNGKPIWFAMADKNGFFGSNQCNGSADAHVNQMSSTISGNGAPVRSSSSFDNDAASMYNVNDKNNNKTQPDQPAPPSLRTQTRQMVNQKMNNVPFSMYGLSPVVQS